jgi:thiol-disulfide isomerase/thioredoxin
MPMPDATVLLVDPSPKRARTRATTGATVLGLALALAALPTLAGDEPAGGIAAGAAVPRFMLPVVNVDTFTTARKWGPNKWVGQTAKPDEKKKVMIMSFFATWCEPCKKEMPELVRLYQTYGDKGLGVMLVSIDERKEREALSAFTKEKALPFPVVHDAWGVVARRYKYPGRLPYLVMASGDGKVTSSHVGYAESFKDDLEKMVTERLGIAPAPKPTEEATPADEGGDDKAATAEEGDDKDDKKKKKGKKKKRKSKKKKKGED